MNFIVSVSVLAILAGLASSQTTTLSPCSIEINVDYLYNDITNQFVASAGACQDLCSAYPTCQTWSYVIQTTACWLKSANRANRVTSPGRVSGGKCATASLTTTVASGVTPPSTTTAGVSPPTTTIGTSTTTTTTVAAGITTTTIAVSPPTTTTATTTTTSTTTPTTTPTTTTTTTTPTTTTTTTTPTTTTTTTTPTTTSTTTTTAAGASTTSSSKKCFLEVSVAYKIATLGSTNTAKSKDDCCALCIAKTGCKAWSFFNDSSLCIFLDYVPLYASQREQSAIAISGVIQ